MIYDSLGFWIMLAAAAALLALAPAAYVRTRCAALVVSSVVVLAAAIGIGPAYACVLFLCVAWVAIAARLAASRGRAGSLVVLLGPVAIAWVFSKSVSAFQPGWLQFAGFSYFFIKAWTLLKDLQDGRVERPDPWEVAAYFLYFPTFVSGPMHLYAEFRETLRNPSFPGREGFVDVVLRVLLGFVKIKVIGPLLAPISLVAVSEGGTLSFTTLAVGSFAYSVVIWANFSGYTDLAVATSRLTGMHTPENFNYPYAAPNIREFWQRWHITFTRVLTSYVFVPLSRYLAGPLGQHPRALMVVCTLATFLFCGFWHGATANFLVWGLYHALGLIVYDVYRPGAARRRLRRKKLARGEWINRVERVLGIALTFSFVSAGWIFFVLPLSRLWGN